MVSDYLGVVLMYHELPRLKLLPEEEALANSYRSAARGEFSFSEEGKSHGQSANLLVAGDGLFARRNVGMFDAEPSTKCISGRICRGDLCAPQHSQ
jgi:hypothetical protein